MLLCSVIKYYIIKTWGSTVDIRKLNTILEDSDEHQQELDKDSTSEEDRYNLLEKYGLQEMDGTDVEELLGSYDNNSLDNKEIEDLERVLTKKIYQAIIYIPSIKKAAVEVFIENHDELYGMVNVIVEYEPKGFLDRIMGTSNSYMDAETVEITQMEISEVFESCPEVVENFEINLESF